MIGSLRRRASRISFCSSANRRFSLRAQATINGTTTASRALNGVSSSGSVVGLGADVELLGWVDGAGAPGAEAGKDLIDLGRLIGARRRQGGRARPTGEREHVAGRRGGGGLSDGLVVDDLGLDGDVNVDLGLDLSTQFRLRFGLRRDGLGPRLVDLGLGDLRDVPHTRPFDLGFDLGFGLGSDLDLDLLG